MAQSKSHQFMLNFLFSAFALLVSYLINFLLTPYITNTLGTEAFGFISLANTVITYISIITVAYNSYSTRFISVEYHNANIKKANIYFSSVFYTNIFIFIVSTIIFAILIGHLEKLLVVSSNLAFDVKILFFLVIGRYILTTISSLFAISATIKNRLSMISFHQSISIILYAFIVICLFVFFKPRVWYIGIAYLTASIYVLCANYYIHENLLPEISPHIRNFSFSAIKDLVLNGIWNSINQLGGVLLTGIDLIIANRIMSAFAMGQLAIVKMLSAVFQALYYLVSQALQPEFLRVYSHGNKEALIRIFKLAIKVSAFIASLTFAGFVVLGLPFLNLWIPNQDTKLLYILTIITVLGDITMGAASPLFTIYTLTLKSRIPCIVTIIGGCIKLITMVLFLYFGDMGLFALVISTTLLNFIGNLLFTPLYAAHCLEIQAKNFLYPIFKGFLLCLLLILSFKTVALFMDNTNWIELMANVIILSTIAIPISYFILFDRSERNLIKEIIRRKTVIFPKASE